MPQQLSLPEFVTTPPPLHNLFFSVLPDVAAAARIERLAQELRGKHGLRGKLLARDRFHVSLINLGAYTWLPTDTVSRAGEAAASIAVAPFVVEFDRVVSFRGRPGAQPLVMLASGDVAALTTLWQALGAAIVKTGIGAGTRSCFTPHLTLLYGEPPVEELAVDAIAWPVREFVLLDSLQGEHRHVQLGRWPLSG